MVNTETEIIVTNKTKTSKIKNGNAQEINYCHSDIKKFAAFFNVLIKIDQKQRKSPNHIIYNRNARHAKFQVQHDD